MDHDVVLNVQDLSIHYQTQRGFLKAVEHVSFELHRGETLAFIGESGCGKSTLNLGLMRLLPRNAVYPNGRVVYKHENGELSDILDMDRNRLRQFRWHECSIVFQGALNSLNPVIRVRDMFYDTARAHGKRDRRWVKNRAMELLEKVRLDADRVFGAYPHELSGGMRQRVLIALALLLDPRVVIMDEPTTAVDILTQRTIIDVLHNIRDEMGFSIIFISHDLAVAAEIADTVATMYAGEIVEKGPVDKVFYEPQHAYTLGLMEATPRLSVGREELRSIPGSPPDLIEPPAGCKFHMRCGFVVSECKVTPPPLKVLDRDHSAACYKSQEVLARSLEKREHAAAD